MMMKVELISHTDNAAHLCVAQIQISRRVLYAMHLILDTQVFLNTLCSRSESRG